MAALRQPEVRPEGGAGRASARGAIGREPEVTDLGRLEARAPSLSYSPAGPWVSAQKGRFGPEQVAEPPGEAWRRWVGLARPSVSAVRVGIGPDLRAQPRAGRLQPRRFPVVSQEEEFQ